MLTSTTEWRETPIRNFANDLIVRLSTRVFFGSELCQNEEYLDHIVTWGNLVLMVNAALRPWPLAFRKIVHMFHPLSRQIRSTRLKIRKIIAPLIAERVALKKQGKTSAKMSDMVGWMEDIIEEKKANVDLIDGQLFIAFAAVETTSTTLAYLILDLLDHPEAVEPLRKEIIEVLSESGWSKTSLMRLKLLDSAMKESQRLHPLSHRKSNP
jgi:cytochrome P450